MMNMRISDLSFEKEETAPASPLIVLRAWPQSINHGWTKML